MKRLTRLLSILFLILLFLISSRFVFFISYVKSQKAEFRKQLIEQNSGNTKTMTISKDHLYIDGNGLEWKENNKELVINGIYHEVIGVTKREKAYRVILIEDKTENNLFKYFFHLNKKAKNSLKDISSLLLVINYLENSSEFKFKRSLQNIRFIPFDHHFNDNSFKGSLLKPPGVFLIS